MVGDPTRRTAGWRGPLVAVGTAAAIVVVAAAAILILQIGSADVDEAPAVDQPPTTTITDALFAPKTLIPTGGAEWSVLGAHHGVVYADSVDKVIMFGGRTPNDPSDVRNDSRPGDQTLVIDLETLVAKALDTASPPPRWHHAMAYDRQSDRVILFGGAPPDEYAETGPDDEDDYSDTWAFDPATEIWEEMNPPQSPPPLSFHDMVYHSTADLVVLVGREGVWTYDYEADTWEMRSTTGTFWHGWTAGSAVVDEASGLIVTVTTRCGPDCGSGNPSFDLKTNLWRSRGRLDKEIGLTPVTVEPLLASAVYDLSSQRIIGYRGWDDTGLVFAYSSESETWIRIGSGPELGDRSPMVHDPIRNQVVIFPSHLFSSPAPDDAHHAEWQIWTAQGRSLGHQPPTP
jgi:hypothetical protein